MRLGYRGPAFPWFPTLFMLGLGGWIEPYLGDPDARESRRIGSMITEILEAHPCAYVLGLRQDDRLHPWYTIEGVVSSGDVLDALGAPKDLATLAGAASPRTT